MQTQRTLPYFFLAILVIAAWGFSNIATKFLYANGMGPYAVLAIRTLIAYGILICPYFFLAILVIAAWGFSNIATKFLYANGMGPYAVLAIRTLIAYGILICLCHGKLLANSIADEARLALLGILCVPIYHGLENLALTEAHAGTVSVIMASAPLLTALLVLLRWRAFRLHWMTKLGICTAITGLILVAFGTVSVIMASAPLLTALLVLLRWRAFRLHWMTKLGICTAITGLILVAFDDLIMSDLPTEGFFLALVAAFAWAVYTAILKSVHNYEPLFVARKTFGWGLVAVMPFFLTEDPTDIALLSDPSLMMALVFLAAWHSSSWPLGLQRFARSCGNALRTPQVPTPFVTVSS